MLYVIAVVLVLLWLVLGSLSSVVLGGFINILLVIALGVVLVRMIGGRDLL